MSNQSNFGLYNSGSYLPFTCTITNITSSNQQTVVTTSVNHQFVIGNEVQFYIPPQWGMRELNNLKGTILNTTANTITVNINSSLFSSFVTPVVTLPNIVQSPQVSPIGDFNYGTQTPGTNPNLQVPGSFRNTFP